VQPAAQLGVNQHILDHVDPAGAVRDVVPAGAGLSAEQPSGQGDFLLGKGLVEDVRISRPQRRGDLGDGGTVSAGGQVGDHFDAHRHPRRLGGRIVVGQGDADRAEQLQLGPVGVVAVPVGEILIEAAGVGLDPLPDLGADPGSQRVQVLGDHGGALHIYRVGLRQHRVGRAGGDRL
jgi:hypothetical protein